MRSAARFADALNSKFQSRAITLSAGISTLAVSVFYLIPQMVGAGVLVQPLLGFSHSTGVIMVGTIVVLIVATAGMVSTTYVQFLKGSLLVIFCAVLTVMILNRGFSTHPQAAKFRPPRVSPEFAESHEPTPTELGAATSDLLPSEGPWKDKPYIRLRDEQSGILSIWRKTPAGDGKVSYWETQTLVEQPDGKKLVNCLPKRTKPGENDFYSVGHIAHLPNGETSTGPLNPLTFFSTLEQSEIVVWGKEEIKDADGGKTVVYYPQPTAGSVLLQPGASPTFKGLRADAFIPKLNFLSLMLALFCGTASLPHILIRYYTVKDQAAARKSTVVGIACIGFFYVLTFFLGLGAMTSGALDVTNNNMSAPLLAKSFGELIFAMISAIAFTTVLGTVSGLIVAASGAVVHDLVVSVGRVELTDHQKVRVGRIAAVGVGLIAIWLGIRFEKMNPSFLVGWAFSVAASANLPSLVMMLFWKRTTQQGIAAGIIVGMISSLAWILLSGDTYKDIYGLPPETALVPFSQPGIVTIPLGFLTVILVSLMTRPNSNSADSK